MAGGVCAAGAFVLIVLVAASHATAQSRVEKNVIYGMYSGLALLMDVHRPEAPNGYGVVFVSGSGWQAPLTYGAVGLKEGQIGLWGPPLLRAGTRCLQSITALRHAFTIQPRWMMFSVPSGMSVIMHSNLALMRAGSELLVDRRARTSLA